MGNIGLRPISKVVYPPFAEYGLVPTGRRHRYQSPEIRINCRSASTPRGTRHWASGLLGESANDHDLPVGQVDDLVRGAAEYQPGQVAAAP